MARALAAGALDQLMGKDAAAFRPLADRTPNGESRTFAFERTEPLDERFEATVDSGRLVKAVLTPTYPHDVDEAVSTRKKYLDWLQGAVGVGIDFVGVVTGGVCVHLLGGAARGEAPLGAGVQRDLAALGRGVLVQLDGVRRALRCGGQQLLVRWRIFSARWRFRSA